MSCLKSFSKREGKRSYLIVIEPATAFRFLNHAIEDDHRARRPTVSPLWFSHYNEAKAVTVLYLSFWSANLKNMSWRTWSFLSPLKQEDCYRVCGWWHLDKLWYILTSVKNRLVQTFANFPFYNNRKKFQNGHFGQAGEDGRVVEAVPVAHVDGQQHGVSHHLADW